MAIIFLSTNLCSTNQLKLFKLTDKFDLFDQHYCVFFKIKRTSVQLTNKPINALWWTNCVSIIYLNLSLPELLSRASVAVSTESETGSSRSDGSEQSAPTSEGQRTLTARLLVLCGEVHSGRTDTDRS